MGQPTLIAVLLAGLVQVDRGYVTDIVLFFGIAVLMVWDGGRSPARGAVPLPAPAPPRRRAAVAVLALVFGALAAALPRRADALDLTMAVPGMVVLWALLRAGRGDWRLGDRGHGDRGHGDRGSRTGTPERPGSRPPADLTGTRAWRVWPALGLTLALVELGSFLGQPDARTDNPDHPTVSTVVEPWLDDTAVRALVIAAWVGMGWWLVRRLRSWPGGAA